MSDRPLLALAIDGELDPLLGRVLAALGRWCRPAVYDVVASHEFEAGLTSSVSLIDAIPTGLPVAVVAHTPDELVAATKHDRVAAVLSTELEVVSAAGGRGVVLPSLQVDFAGMRPVPVHVRRRLRQSAGLPDVAVAEFTSTSARWCDVPLSADLIDTALGVASVVVVQGPLLLRALAWGAACVTDRSALHLQLTADEEVVVANPPDLSAVAHELAGDDPRAMKIAVAGRRWLEHNADPVVAAVELARRLHLLPRGVGRVDALATELGTPVTAVSQARVHEHLALFHGEWVA